MKKMKKWIVLCSFFIIFLLLSTSMIPAVELHIARDVYKDKLSSISLGNKPLTSSIHRIFQKNDVEKHSFDDLIQLIISNQHNLNSDIGQTSVVILDIIIIFLFLYLVFKGIPNLVDTISSVLISLGSNVSSLLKFILTLLANSISFILESLITLIIGLGKIIVNIVEVVGIAVFSIIAGIVFLIAMVVYGVIYSAVKLAGIIWNVIEIVFGLILDILRLVYEAIFQPGIVS